MLIFDLIRFNKCRKMIYSEYQYYSMSLFNLMRISKIKYSIIFNLAVVLLYMRNTVENQIKFLYNIKMIIFDKL